MDVNQVEVCGADFCLGGIRRDAEYIVWVGHEELRSEEVKLLFVKAVEGADPVVREPGPDVLRLRIAITDLVPNAPEASVVSLVVPFMWVGEAGAGAAKGQVGSTPFLGEATVEAEALDSESSKQVAAYIEERVGKKYNWTHGVDTAVKDYLKAYSTWAYTKQAMDQWAQQLRQSLDEWHGKTTPKQ